MKVKCPVCYAEFNVPDTVTTVTCPYCGATFIIKRDKVMAYKEGHFYFPLDKRDPFDLLMRFIERQYGAPADIRSFSSQIKRDLYFIPVHFFYIYGKAKVYGDSKKFGNIVVNVEELDYIGIPAVNTPEARLLNGYPFPIRGKRFFEENIKKKGIYYDPKIDKKTAEEIAQKTLYEILNNEAKQSIDHMRNILYENIIVDYRGLVHYPLWRIIYRYKGKEYVGYVDGATGIIIQTEHPLTTKGRIEQFGIALLLIGIGLALGVLLYTMKHELASFASFISGFVSAFPALTRSVSLKVQASELQEMDEKKKVLFNKLVDIFI